MNTVLEKFKKHPILLHAEELQNLCKPLAFFNITTFTHLQVDTNNRLAGLSNHPDCWVNYVNNHYFEADPLVVIKPETIDLGQYLVWDAVDCRGQVSAMVQDAADFNFRHVFTIIKNDRNFMNYYSFGTHELNPSIYQTYIRNIDLLDRFICNFNHQVSQSKHLLGAYDFSINPDTKPSGETDCRENFQFPYQLESRQLFLSALSKTGPNKSKLTHKEMECAKLLIEGKSAKEIAASVQLSFRTIEDRIKALRIKFNAKNKSDLIAKLVRWL
jgi:DNA-binding CsgD family transcriptional regulator